MLDPAAPGNPVYATTPETLASVLHQSANFGFVNVALNAAGLHAVPDIAENPVSEALFNFAAAWGLAFLPLMLTDRRCPRHVPTGPLWLGSWLLTNLFLTPWMARRVERGEPRGDDGREGGVARALSTPLAARGIGAVCAAMGLVAVAWLFVGRDGLGFADAGLPRVAELARLVTTSRVDYGEGPWVLTCLVVSGRVTTPRVGEGHACLCVRGHHWSRPLGLPCRLDSLLAHDV